MLIASWTKCLNCVTFTVHIYSLTQSLTHLARYHHHLQQEGIAAQAVWAAFCFCFISYLVCLQCSEVDIDVKRFLQLDCKLVQKLQCVEFLQWFCLKDVEKGDVFERIPLCPVATQQNLTTWYDIKILKLPLVC